MGGGGTLGADPGQVLVPWEHRSTRREQRQILSAGCPEKELLEWRISGSHLVSPWMTVTPCCHPTRTSRVAGFETAGASGLAAGNAESSTCPNRRYIAFKGKKKS